MKALGLLLIPTIALAGSVGPEPYPELPITYQPDLPTEYSIAGIADDIHDENSFSVTLQKREPLEEAVQRLKTKSRGVGGIVYIPWDLDTIQCDSVYLNRKKNLVESITLEGVMGPNGQRPRFYCRRERAGGHIPNKGVAGPWIQSGAVKTTVIKNIEVDGYNKFWAMSSTPHAIIKNNYFHNATNDGFTSNNIYSLDAFYGRDYETGDRLWVFAGNEISHAGQGNTKHCLYMHRSYKEGVKTKLVVMNNNIYSCNWSSGVKSIANVNRIIDNNFWKYKDVGDQPRRYTQMAVDISACSDTVVEGNTFHNYRPLGEKSAGNYIIGVRNRKSMYGCDTPTAWVAGQVLLPDGKKHECARNPLVKECQKRDSDFWKPEWWAAKNGVKDFPFIIRNNVFNVGGFEADRARVILARGTYPNYTYTLGGWACPLEVAEGWYERSIVKVSGNTYNGTSVTPWTYRSEPLGWGHPTKCLTPPPEKDLREWDMIEVGEGEVFNPPPINPNEVAE